MKTESTETNYFYSENNLLLCPDPITKEEAQIIVNFMGWEKTKWGTEEMKCVYTLK